MFTQISVLCNLTQRHAAFLGSVNLEGGLKNRPSYPRAIKENRNYWSFEITMVRSSWLLFAKTAKKQWQCTDRVLVESFHRVIHPPSDMLLVMTPNYMLTLSYLKSISKD